MANTYPLSRPAFFTRGEELPSVHQWASRSDQAKEGGGYGRTNTVHTKFLFLNVICRNILTLLMTHEASAHHSLPCTARQRGPRGTVPRGTRHLTPHSPATLIGCYEAGQKPITDGWLTCSAYLLIHQPFYTTTFIQRRIILSSLLQCVIRIVKYVCIIRPVIY